VGSGRGFSSKFVEEEGHHPEDGRFNSNHNFGDISHGQPKPLFCSVVFYLGHDRNPPEAGNDGTFYLQCIEEMAQADHPKTQYLHFEPPKFGRP